MVRHRSWLRWHQLGFGRASTPYDESSAHPNMANGGWRRPAHVRRGTIAKTTATAATLHSRPYRALLASQGVRWGGGNTTELWLWQARGASAVRSWAAGNGVGGERCCCCGRIRKRRRRHREEMRAWAWTSEREAHLCPSWPDRLGCRCCKAATRYQWPNAASHPRWGDGIIRAPCSSLIGPKDDAQAPKPRLIS